MSLSSKTGLIPTQKKLSKSLRTKSLVNSFRLTPTVVKSANFSIRPFGGLFNPYSKGCSVLCNHPAPQAVRTIIKKTKDSWKDTGHDDISSHIPEDLFRRYTGTDSRPLTPSPTTASLHTRTSAASFLNARRCVTPEPGKDANNKRKQIILDLRRSHSQETLYWKASSEVSQGIGGIGTYTSSSTSYQQTKITKNPKIDDTKLKISQPIQDESTTEDIKPPAVCINERETEDNDILQRRGKKKKKSKQHASSSIFHINQDPETQVSALGPDSLTASTRPSLVPNVSVKLLNCSEASSGNKSTQLQNSYLTEEAFRALKTELDIDIIENTFERYLNRALREAMKFVVHKKERPNNNSNEFKEPSFEHKKMPRKFAKSASRFEVPLNPTCLEGITVYDYLSKHVWVSRQRKQLYKKIFLKYLLQPESPDFETVNYFSMKERAILVDNFDTALTEILGFYANKDIIKQIGDMLNISQQKAINFRSWCGIVAFAERYILAEPTATDSCDELEKADFDTIEQTLTTLHISADIHAVLSKIRQGHKSI